MRASLLNPPIAVRRGLAHRRLFFSMLLVCFAVLYASAHCQTITPQERPMKHYVLIFHTTRTLNPEEVHQRGADIAVWVKQVTEMGIEPDPRTLEQTLANFSAKGNQIISHEGSSDPTSRNLVFFDAASGEQAVTVARTHPALHYGATVEVREWTSPRETASTR
jgi:hypothetical protein